MPRSIYVISDLHLGGRAARGPGERGFGIMSRPEALEAFLRRIDSEPDAELVVNGDFVDFLAEEHADGQPWRIFIADPDEAVAAFEAIHRGAPGVFDALGRLARSHPLTILLGNHDLELALPDVRDAFERRAGLTAGRYRFLYDNEALVLGTALVEHGNRYDPVNIVDYDGLRRLRSLHSRRQYAEEAGFVPPPGSELVATVMNPIKVDYPFIDLLKPESEALFALLLALDPGSRRRLGSLAWVLRRVPLRSALSDPGRPVFRREISAIEDPATEGLTEEDALQDVLASTLPAGALAAFDEEPSVRREISGAGARAVLEGLVLGRRWGWERRIAQLRAAVGALANDESFSREVETGKGYREAAAELSQRGERFTHVVFGHTHQAKDLALAGGGRYLNSGAWADRMRFPRAILSSDLEESRQAVEKLLLDCATGNLDGYIEFEPGCVHVEVGDTTRVRYRAYDAKADRLEP